MSLHMDFCYVFLNVQTASDVMQILMYRTMLLTIATLFHSGNLCQDLLGEIPEIHFYFIHTEFWYIFLTV